MKAKRQILTACAVACALLCAACSDPKPEEKQEEKKPFVLKDNTHLYLNVDNTNTMKAETKKGSILLSPRNIVKYTSGITFTNKDGLTARLAIFDDQRDYEHNRIIMYAGMIIGPVPHMIDGKRTDVYELLDDFIKARDVRLEICNLNEITTDDGVVIPALTYTIAYIPNAKMEQAEKDIRKAWESKDNEAVYKFFNDAYTFTPIANDDWEKLKEKGEL